MTQPATPPMAQTEAAPDRPNLLWGVSIASFIVFLTTLALSWAKAYVINDDLPNFCDDVRRGSFPPEVACVSGNGTVTGANAGWVEVLFFASFTVSVMFAAMAFAIVAAVRKR